MNYEHLAKQIAQDIGGLENITTFTNCMTRLRVNVKDTSKVSVEALSDIAGVIGVVPGAQTQVIVGAGHAERLRTAFAMVVAASDNVDVAQQTKSAIKAKQTTHVQTGLKHIGNIFAPLIPGFVATGMLAAVANIIRTSNPQVVSNPWFALFAAGGGLLIAGLNVLTGYNAAKEFGGTPVLGAIMGSLIGAPALLGIAPNVANGIGAQELSFIVPIINYTVKLAPNLGGVIGVIGSAYFCVFVEKQLRKVVPPVLELFVIPVLSVFVSGLITLFVIMPIAAVLMNGLIYLLLDVLLHRLGVLGSYVLATLFLPMVMLGIHQAFIPLHAELIANQGYTVLLPIMAMAGAGQVGAALAICLKTKDKKLKATAISGIPVGILGVGEPLIYGVSLPLLYPFITACLGAGFGGAVIALGNLVQPVGAVGIGPSGALLIALIANGQWLWYVGGLAAAYVGGFILTYLFGYNDEMLERLR